MKKILITGGAGFIGHHIVAGVLKDTDWEVIILDRLDISGNLERLRDMGDWEKEKNRVKFVWWDLKAEINDFASRKIGEVNYIWHLAASSHVNRSIEDPLSFVMDNVVGTCNILNFARKIKGLELFINFGTDEVFGPAPEETFYKEWDRYKSANPYAATKAGAEELCLAFWNTYKLPIICTHTMNVFGERQHPEKFIPLIIRSVLEGKTVFIHANKEKTKAGVRAWIHARNICKAMLLLTDNHDLGEKYNLVGEKELDNLFLALKIASIIGKPLKYEMTDSHFQRPGHDLRYSLDGTKLKEMGFEYPKTFEESLEKTVQWYLDHKEWLLLYENKETTPE